VLIAISTSGNSGNVIKAIHVAKELGIKVIALSGRDGGQIKSIADLSIIVPSQTTARIQEAHIFIGHLICGLVEKNLGLSG
jgi:D-sedoheptulose 7-phosphate isomerase